MVIVAGTCLHVGSIRESTPHRRSRGSAHLHPIEGLSRQRVRHSPTRGHHLRVHGGGQVHVTRVVAVRVHVTHFVTNQAAGGIDALCLVWRARTLGARRLRLHQEPRAVRLARVGADEGGADAHALNKTRFRRDSLDTI